MNFVNPSSVMAVRVAAAPTSTRLRRPAIAVLLLLAAILISVPLPSPLPALPQHWDDLTQAVARSQNVAPGEAVQLLRRQERLSQVAAGIEGGLGEEENAGVWIDGGAHNL